MSDLVKRLREVGPCGININDLQIDTLCNEAADEIERLEHDVRWWQEEDKRLWAVVDAARDTRDDILSGDFGRTPTSAMRLNKALKDLDE